MGRLREYGTSSWVQTGGRPRVGAGSVGRPPFGVLIHLTNVEIKYLQSLRCVSYE